MPDRLRGIFDEDADRYDRARPGYPAELIAELAQLCGLGAGSRVLEIGPGTGQATLPLADLGAVVTAVELGTELAGVLARRAAGRTVEVVRSAFEDFPTPVEPYAAVVSFTAWHWLTPGVRVDRAAEALRGGGFLATVSTIHVSAGPQDTFPVAVQRCYERWDPATTPGLVMATAEQVEPVRDEVDLSPRFAPAVRRRYTADVTYTAEEYLDLLQTFSGHRALAPDLRAGLLACIRDLIEREYGGSITKRYLYELRVARAIA
jgi:SAM-dependent methyltransferase